MNICRDRETEGSEAGGARYVQRGDPWRSAQAELFVTMCAPNAMALTTQAAQRHATSP